MNKDFNLEGYDRNIFSPPMKRSDEPIRTRNDTMIIACSEVNLTIENSNKEKSNDILVPILKNNNKFNYLEIYKDDKSYVCVDNLNKKPLINLLETENLDQIMFFGNIPKINTTNNDSNKESNLNKPTDNKEKHFLISNANWFVKGRTEQTCVEIENISRIDQNNKENESVNDNISIKSFLAEKSENKNKVNSSNKPLKRIKSVRNPSEENSKLNQDFLNKINDDFINEVSQVKENVNLSNRISQEIIQNEYNFSSNNSVNYEANSLNKDFVVSFENKKTNINNINDKNLVIKEKKKTINSNSSSIAKDLHMISKESLESNKKPQKLLYSSNIVDLNSNYQFNFLLSPSNLEINSPNEPVAYKKKKIEVILIKPKSETKNKNTLQNIEINENFNKNQTKNFSFKNLNEKDGLMFSKKESESFYNVDEDDVKKNLNSNLLREEKTDSKKHLLLANKTNFHKNYNYSKTKENLSSEKENINHKFSKKIGLNDKQELESGINNNSNQVGHEVIIHDINLNLDNFNNENKDNELKNKPILEEKEIFNDQTVSEIQNNSNNLIFDKKNVYKPKVISHKDMGKNVKDLNGNKEKIIESKDDLIIFNYLENYNEIINKSINDFVNYQINSPKISFNTEEIEKSTEKEIQDNIINTQSSFDSNKINHNLKEKNLIHNKSSKNLKSSFDNNLKNLNLTKSKSQIENVTEERLYNKKEFNFINLVVNDKENEEKTNILNQNNKIDEVEEKKNVLLKLSKQIENDINSLKICQYNNPDEKLVFKIENSSVDNYSIKIYPNEIELNKKENRIEISLNEIKQNNENNNPLVSEEQNKEFQLNLNEIQENHSNNKHYSPDSYKSNIDGKYKESNNNLIKSYESKNNKKETLRFDDLPVQKSSDKILQKKAWSYSIVPENHLIQYSNLTKNNYREKDTSTNNLKEETEENGNHERSLIIEEIKDQIFVNKETNKFNEEPNFSIDKNSEIQKTLIIEDVLINEKASILINSNLNNENDINLKNTSKENQTTDTSIKKKGKSQINDKNKFKDIINKDLNKDTENDDNDKNLINKDVIIEKNILNYDIPSERLDCIENALNISLANESQKNNDGIISLDNCKRINNVQLNSNEENLKFNGKKTVKKQNLVGNENKRKTSTFILENENVYDEKRP